MERLRRNRAFAIELCRGAAERLFEASGGSGLYEATDLPRMWRDAHAAAAHASLRWNEAATRYGRAALGLPPSTPAGR
jgi:3-hydroxy-9,10-secoandrosta-1,3,5(10)-triene-9,17-dione monooxygenase